MLITFRLAVVYCGSARRACNMLIGKQLSIRVVYYPEVPAST